MAVEVEIDVDLLKSEIKKTYASVSDEPEKDFIFPTGRAWAEDLGYPDELASVPDLVAESFAVIAALQIAEHMAMCSLATERCIPSILLPYVEEAMRRAEKNEPPWLGPGVQETSLNTRAQCRAVTWLGASRRHARGCRTSAGLALGCDHVEHVPVLRPAHGGAVFVLFVEQVDIEPVEQPFHFFARMKCHVRRTRPAVVRPEEVPGKDTLRPYSHRDAAPHLGEFAGVAEREAQAGVDEVCVRQLQLVEGRDDRRQPRAVAGRHRGAKACDRCGRAVDGDDRPAARQQRERLGAVSTAQVDCDQCLIVLRLGR